MLWQPFHLKLYKTHLLPQHETGCQWSVHNISACILGNRRFARVNELRRESLTSCIANNMMFNRKNTDSKSINITDCKICKKRSFAVEYLIWAIYNYPTAKIRTLYKSTDGPTEWHGDIPPNADGLGDSIEPGPNWQFCWINNLEYKFVKGLDSVGPRLRPEATVPHRCSHYTLPTKRISVSASLQQLNSKRGGV
jgi:hypothetical protein